MSIQLEARTVASGSALSSSIRIRSGAVTAIFISSSVWTSADMTFQGSVDGTTFYNLYDGETEYAITPTVGAAHKVDPLIFIGWPYIRFRSGTSATPVNQGGERSIKAIISEQF